MSTPDPLAQNTMMLGAPPPGAKPIATMSALKPSPTPAQAAAAKTSLDLSKYQVDPKDPNMDKSKWDKRADGASKGTGFLGMLKRPDGSVSSEISVGLEINGKEMDVPTLVPTLNQQEVEWLLNNDIKDPSKIPKSIIQKAARHAQSRIAQGLPVFAN